MTLEQIIRDVLEQAVKEGIVCLPPDGEWGSDPHPQARTAGELSGVANLLGDRLKDIKQNEPI